MFKNLKDTLSFCKTLILALICAGIIRSLWFEPFHIPSGSMKPGLLEGDYIIVTKYSYGYSRYSFPFGLNFFEDRVWFKEGEVKRGDAAVFRLPSRPSINYIKRIIGVPGDEIQVRSGILFVNNKEVKRIKNGSYIESFANGNVAIVDKFQEKIGEKSFDVIDFIENSEVDNTGIFKVPAGHYFAMGDNRDNSEDSRYLDAVGYIPQQNLVGKARFIFFSVKGSFLSLFTLNGKIRFDRIFKSID